MKSGAADTGSMRGGHLLQEKEVFVALETFTDGTDVEKHLFQTFIGVCRHRTQQNRCEKKNQVTDVKNTIRTFFIICVCFFFNILLTCIRGFFFSKV